MTKKRNYNPGPWTLDQGQIRDREGWALASVPLGIGDETDQANGRLMAAAPELLEAALKMLDILENMTTAEFSRGADKEGREALAAAIKAAIGD